MCIAIAKPADKELTKETLQTCWDNNSDGAGFMYNVNGSLKIKKGFFRFDDFWKSYSNSCQDKKAVVHFRIKTHGNIDVENCHPFKVNPGLAFVHNGVIHSVDTTKDKEKSDTWHFNSQLLQPLINKYIDILETDAAQMLIGEFIGHSKLVFLDSKDNITIINADKGVEDDGIWYSNTSYKQSKKRKHHQVYSNPPQSRTMGGAIIETRKPWMPTAISTPPSWMSTNDLEHEKSKVTPKYSKGLEEGDLISLVATYKNYSAGTDGIIKSINSNRTANVNFYDERFHLLMVEEFVPFYFLEPVSIFTQGMN